MMTTSERPDGERVIADLRLTLLSARNADGGWGYFAGKVSRLEPTSWATLSLIPGSSDPERADLGGTLTKLAARWQSRSGLLCEPNSECNLAFNGLASLALEALRRPGAPSLVESLLDGVTQGLIASYGTSTPNRMEERSLGGWPWRAGTYTWVEPTALCLLALKQRTQLPPAARARVASAEGALLERSCRGGGWNYGNATALGTDLRAYVPPTALALLALRDRRSHSRVAEALTYLQAACGREKSGMALALAMICLAAYGLDVSVAHAELLAAARRTAFLGNVAVTSMARFAFLSQAHGISIFAI